MGLAGPQAHVALVPLVDPALEAQGRSADGAAQTAQTLVGEGGVAAGVTGEGQVLHRGGAFLQGALLPRLAAEGELPGGLGIAAQAGLHVQMGADQAGVVGVPQGVVGHAGLLDAEVLHGGGKGLLVFVALGLHIVDQLEVHPAVDPVPVLVVDDDVLLQDALVVIAPGEEGAALAAESPELPKGLHKAGGVAQAVPVDAGELFHLVVHLAEIDRLHVDLEFLAGGPVVVQLDRANLDDLPAQMDGEVVEDGALGAHRLVPFQVHHDITDDRSPLSVVVCAGTALFFIIV